MSPPEQHPHLRLLPEEPHRPEHPSFLTMVGLVAMSVAITILVFFGIGYAFGRLFL